MNSKNIDVKSLLDPDENPSVATAPTDILEVHEDQRATVLIKDIVNFKNAVNNLLKPDIQEDLTENAISFNDITDRLNPTNLNLETGVFVTPIVGQPATFKASDGFHGFAEVNTKPLEEVIVEKLAPSNFVRGEGILVQADLVDYSGIGQLTVKNIALNDKAAYVITQEDVETFSNTETNFIELDLTNMKVLTEIDGKPAVSTDAPADTFGASKLYLNVPLVPNKIITVDANNLGATLTPAGIPVNLDGTESSNKDGYGALGYKAITLNADLVALDAQNVLKKAKEGGGTLTPGNVSIGFNAVSIPNLTPQIYTLELDQSTNAKVGEITFTTDNVTIYEGLKYNLKAIPTRAIDLNTFLVQSIALQHFSKLTKLEFLPDGTGNGDSYLESATPCEAISKFTLQIPGSYNTYISEDTMSSLIARGCSSIEIDSRGISADYETLDSNSYDSTGKILTSVHIDLPGPATNPIQIIALDNVKIGTKTGENVSHGTYLYQTGFDAESSFMVGVSGSGSYYYDSLTISQYDSETNRELHKATFEVSGSLSSAPLAIEFIVSQAGIYSTVYKDADYDSTLSWTIEDKHNEANPITYTSSNKDDLSTALETYKLDNNNKFYIVATS